MERLRHLPESMYWTPTKLLKIAAAAALLFGTTGCIEQLIGTCCCLTADKGASVKARDECTSNGGICTNETACANPSPSSSPSRSRLASLRSHSFSLDRSAAVLLEMSGYVETSPPHQGSVTRGDHPAPAACDQECASNGPFCLRVNLKNDGGMVGKVEKARKLLLKKDRDHISTKEFMNIFDIGTDPCDRKDTILTATALKNDGDSCFLSSSVVNPKGTLSFKVHIPAKLEGDRTVASDNITLLFKNPETSPDLTIGDPALNRDFGGKVQRATANAQAGVVSTERGCVAVRMLQPGTQ